jgi:tRNA(Ile)-lysidine synthase
MNLLQRFQDFISEHQLFARNETLLLAVSGGVDSVVLCELFKQSGYSFIIAHCNFKLRAEESERDAAFVQQLATHYNVPFLMKEFDTKGYAASKKLSIQEAARELRYGWFEELTGSKKYEVGSRKSEAGSLRSEVGSQNSEVRSRKSEGANRKSEAGDGNPKHGEGAAQEPTHHSPLTTHHSPLTTHLVTAHHLDDNIETMLMHFFRGTGIHGLRGMLPKQGNIVRPLLFVRKQELKQFAEENKLQWVEDSSNAMDKYSRNYFRNQLIPFVQKIYPETENNLAGNLRRFADMEMLYDQALDLHKKKLLEYKGEEIHIPVLKLKKSVPLHTIAYEIIKEFGFTSAQTDEVIHLLDSESGRFVQSASHRIIKNRRWLIIAPVQSEHAQTLIIEEDDDAIVFESGRLVIDHLAIDSKQQAKGKRQLAPGDSQPATGFTEWREQLPKEPSIAFIDRKEVQFPLILRKWKKGDYFYPLGLNKKKKLARFFIDQKLSLTDKEKVWVLESNKKIVWVVGMRIDDRFKVTEATKQILHIKLQKDEVGSRK